MQIQNAILTGSTTVYGPIIFVSGTLAGSASYAATSSYADTFTVAGSLTAQTLVVQTITSSVSFITGSTRFGSLLTNTHDFTGSVRITGSGPHYVFGNVGIGTSSPGYTLDVRTDTGVLIKGATSNSDAILSFLPTTGGRQYDFRNFGSSFAILDSSANITRMYFNFSGNTGIGLTNPSALLHVSGSGSGSLMQISSHVSSSIFFVSGSGNVGFGTLQPSARVHATGSGIGIIGDAVDNFFGNYSTGDYIDIGHLGAVGSVFLDTRGTSTNVNLCYRTKGTGNHIWTYGGGVSEAMRINGVGNVGIGTTAWSSAYKLMVANDGSNGYIGVTNQTGTTGNRVLRMGFGSGQTYASIQGTRVDTADDVNIVMQAGGGNVGINTTSDLSQKLVVNQGATAINQGIPATSGTTQNGIFRLRPSTSLYGETFDFGMNVSASPYAWIQATNAGGLNVNYPLILNPNGGNVGIGTSSPSSLLHISGAGTGQMLRIQNTSTVSGDQGPMIQFVSANQVGGQNFESGYIQSIWTGEGNAFSMRFAVKVADGGQVERMRITSGGSVGIGATPSSTWAIRSVLQLGTFGTTLSGYNGGGGSTGLMHNVVANGFTYTYMNNGGATSIYMDGANIALQNAPSSTAGASMTMTTRFQMGTLGFAASVRSAGDADSKTFMNELNTSCGLIPTPAGTTLYLYNRDGSTNYRVLLTSSTYFTGQHGNKPINEDLKTNIQNYIGMIVSSAGSYYSVNPITQEITTGSAAILISEALPEVVLTTTDMDKSVWGVVTNMKNDNHNTDGTIDYDNDTEWGDRLGDSVIRINGLGEGAIWITNINGNIENGDYVCSSIIPGYGRKQNDDLLHNYTVAKSTMNCDFDLNNNGLYQCEEFEYEGTTYKKAFIGCTYHCS